MSDTSQGPGWWQASDNNWYPPEQHPDYVPLEPLAASPVSGLPASNQPAEPSTPLATSAVSPTSRVRGVTFRRHPIAWGIAGVVGLLLIGTGVGNALSPQKATTPAAAGPTATRPSAPVAHVADLSSKLVSLSRMPSGWQPESAIGTPSGCLAQIPSMTGLTKTGVADVTFKLDAKSDNFEEKLVSFKGAAPKAYSVIVSGFQACHTASGVLNGHKWTATYERFTTPTYGDRSTAFRGTFRSSIVDFDSLWVIGQVGGVIMVTSQTFQPTIDLPQFENYVTTAVDTINGGVANTVIIPTPTTSPTTTTTPATTTTGPPATYPLATAPPATAPPATAPPATYPLATAPPPAAPPATNPPQNLPVVYGGAFCSTPGASGITSGGTVETCMTTATDSRYRWRS